MRGYNRKQTKTPSHSQSNRFRVSIHFTFIDQNSEDRKRKMENSVGNLSLSVVGAAHFSSIDYTVFSALVAISLAIGLYFGISGRNGQSAEEYLHGGHSMRPIPVAFSLIARYVSRWPSRIISDSICAFSASWRPAHWPRNRWKSICSAGCTFYWFQRFWSFYC